MLFVSAYPRTRQVVSDCGNVISVSAVDLEDDLAPYSNFGSTIDVAAPGGDFSADANGDGFGDGVLSTWVDPATLERIYGFAQGTSMAAPHVAAVIAIMLDVNPGLTPFHIDQMLAEPEWPSYASPLKPLNSLRSIRGLYGVQAESLFMSSSIARVNSSRQWGATLCDRGVLPSTRRAP